MLTLSTQLQSDIMFRSIGELSKFIASEGFNFADGWYNYDANTQINIWTDDTEDSEETGTTTFFVTAYYYDVLNYVTDYNNFYRVGSIAISRRVD